MAKRFIGNVKGVGVSDFSWEYYLSSSSAVLDGGSWSATPPTLGNNKYLWMRSKVTLTDGSIQYTVPVCEGVWEEIYGIYAIGDKVDGALSDVTDLKSRMTAEENKVQPLNKGGTGKTTRAAAMNYMQYIPASDLSFLTGSGGGDTTANWVKAGTGLAYISTEGLLENQPMKYGWLYNFTPGSVIVAQQFIGLDGNSPVWYRSGNASGWYPGSKNWVKSLDEKNGVQIKKLWTNASPRSDFPAQMIKLNVTDASFTLVVFKVTKSSSLWRVAILTCDGNSYIMDAPYNTDYASVGTVIGTAFRAAIWKSNGIEFGKGYSKDHLDKNPVERPSFVIPIMIFAVKGAI